MTGPSRLRRLLDEIVATRGRTPARIEQDPVRIVRRYSDPRDVEVAGLLSSALAFGRVDLFLPVLERLFERLGPSPSATAVALSRGPARDALALARGLSYRWTRPRDVGDLVRVVGRAADRPGGLEALFLEGDDPAASDLAPALARFRDALLDGAPPEVDATRTGLARLLPDPKKGSATKRLWLFLRWMVREDEVDPGAWRRVDRARLLVPLDVHVHRAARSAGLTRRKGQDLETAREVTAALRELDPEDPVRYDFALCHLGMEAGRVYKRSRGCS